MAERWISSDRARYTDPETGLLYLINRYYDPATGVFISRDPLVALTGSAYSYVDDNPLNGTDPLGLFHIPGTSMCFHVPGTNDGCNAPGPNALLSARGANQALNTAATVFGAGGLAADLTGAGAPVGIVLGAVGSGFSGLAAVEQCFTAGLNRECAIQTAAALINADTVGVSAAAGHLDSDIAARLVGLGADLVGQLSSFLDDNLRALFATACAPR